ncbi:MAG: Asp-tRNA(Asn)/Glu-tRNA(Gln) amidotransferase GatCAB subunit A [Rhodospirillaceae bacterium]|nr:Asp-tRNA(Asn)/Glu-tRNA(Gln) amidotransferase GatCAB subunit A [Rhodospirillaceae bacterium]
MSDNLSTLDLCSLASRVRSREISAEEVTLTAIARAEALQLTLNAFIRLEADTALAQARAIDARIAKGEIVGPLAGVPLAHKDMFYRDGMPTTCGSKIRADFVANRTSTALARLAEADAIDLGGLNMSEFAVGPIGNNVHYGDCRNPWNPEHAPGGSSSGSAASVAARIVFGALGSDTGGSIRIPSAMSGVVGLKPTQNRVSRYGLMPLSFSFDTSGPLTRTVRDAARLLDTIAGYDPNDPTSSRRPGIGCEAACDRPLDGLRLGIPTSYFFDDLDPEVASALEAAQKAFRDIGVQLRSVPVPSHNEINLIWAAALSAEAATIHRKWLRERPGDYGPMVRRRIEFGLYQPATRYLEALSLRETFLRDYCATAFEDCDVLLTPTMPVTAPRLDEVDVSDGKGMTDLVLKVSRNTRPISYLGLPALSVPCGFNEAGLPMAIQLIGRPFGEAQLCQLGHAYQKVTDWHTHIPTLAKS